MRYGFLGLGIMGRAMAANLIDAGMELSVWNRSPEKCTPLVELGARQCETAAAVVADCDIIFAMVSDPEAAQDLCFGEDGVLQAMSANKGYVDVSTVDDETSLAIARAITAEGGRFLEAPVSGSKKPAEDGALVFLCAGDRSLYDEALPAFEVMGKKSFYYPEVGQAARMKLVINMIMGSMMTAFAEGLSLGDKSGLEKEAILEVLGQGAINNPMFQLKGPLMAAANFSPAFPLKHMQKDMRLALLLGDELGQSLFTAAAANNLYVRAMGEGSGDLDFSAVQDVI